MANADQEKSKQRRRVPLLCLICKKRKVKCDKARPSCGGCTKNDVAHLCTYLEPYWTEGVHDKAEIVKERIEDSEEYRQFKLENEKIIAEQKREIELLRRELSVKNAQTVAVANDAKESISEANKETITILHKLCPPNLQSREGLVVQRDLAYTILGPARLRTVHIDTYNWVNLIRLDPNLTTLWYKITSLQKMYHNYKMSQLKYNKEEMTTPEQMSGKCPVGYDIDLMSEKKSQPKIEGQGRLANAQSDYSPIRHSKVKNNDHAHFSAFQDISRHLIIKLQTLWDKVLNHSGSKSNYHQISSILDNFFASLLESVRILLFYKSEIVGLISGDSERVTLALSGETGSDEEILWELTANGIYSCMLALIVEDTAGSDITSTAEKCPLGGDSAAGAVCPVTGSRATTPDAAAPSLIPFIQETLLYIHKKTLQVQLSNKSMAYVACSISLLNKLMGSSERSTLLYDNLLEVVVGGGLELWKNPELVTMSGKAQKKLGQTRPKLESKQSQNSRLINTVNHFTVPLHLTHLWHDLLRISNLTTFSLLPHSNHPLIPELNLKIDVANQSLHHLKFLSSLATPQQSLSFLLHVNYLVSKIFGVIHHGMWKFGEPKLHIFTLQDLIDECLTWLTEPGLANLPLVRRFEIISLLSYLRIFMLYGILLQAEEVNDEDMLTLVSPVFFIRLFEFVNFIKSTLDNGCENNVVLAVIELLNRTIQIIIGVLIRARSHLLPKSQRSMLGQEIHKNSKIIDEKMTAEIGIGVAEYVRAGLSDLVGETVSLLASRGKQSGPGSQSDESDSESDLPHEKLAKIWKFYLAFINNSYKVNGVSYSKFHEKIPSFNLCPVKHESSGSLVIPSAIHFKKCPISHITTPMYDFEKPPSPLLYEASADPKKRKCPFDHSSLKSLQIGKGIESNVRLKRRASPLSQTEVSNTSMKTSFPSQMMEMSLLTVKVVTSPVGNLIEQENLAPSSVLPELLNDDLNGLLDFDLDFLSNLNLFDQIGTFGGM